jgi:predicted membrane protein
MVDPDSFLVSIGLFWYVVIALIVFVLLYSIWSLIERKIDSGYFCKNDIFFLSSLISLLWPITMPILGVLLLMYGCYIYLNKLIYKDEGRS